MSNFLAIATVTATMRELLQATAQRDVDGVTVTTARPDSSVNAAPEPRINIYLYQVTPNAAWRNADLPTRRSDGSIIQRPQVALDLHYMISFYGDEGQLVSQRLLGSVARTLHAYPLLTRENIRNTITNVTAPGGTFPFLATSDLADDVELVKFSPLHLSLEELSKIWSVFFQIPYVLSVAYQGTVVLIESDDMPQYVLPVRRRNIYVVPFDQPIIEQIATTEGENQPITTDSVLRILGKNLRGEITMVRIGGIDVVPTPDNVSDTEITLSLADVSKTQTTQPPLNLQAGVQGIQIIHRMQMGMDQPDKPLEAHRGVESNVTPFVLRPTITKTGDNYDIALDLQGAGNTPRSGKVTIKLKPAVGKAQRVVLLLNEINPTPAQSLDHTPRAYSFEALASEQTWQKNEAGEEVSDTIIFSVKNIRPGTYLVRVRVDGAESLLDVDTNPKSPTLNTYVRSPQVTI